MSRYLSFLTAIAVSFFLFVVSAFSQDVVSRFNVESGQFTLDATSVVSEGEGPLVYSWTLVSGPVDSATFIVSPSEPITRFTADISGSYSVELQITDNGIPLTPLQLNLSTDASAPEAGFNVVGLPDVGASVRLDAVSSYHPDGLSLTYEWQVIDAPVGSVATIADSAAGTAGFVRNFTPDVEGTYEVVLTVSDLSGSSDTTSRRFTTNAVLPVADAGPDRSVELGATILLDPFNTTLPNSDGTAEGSDLSASWSILHRPSGSLVELLEVVEGRQPFAADVAGLYVLQLAVSGVDGSDKDTVVISAGDASVTNVAPVARIDALRIDGTSVATGPSISADVLAGEALTLSGGASSDDDGDMLFYQWEIVSAPEGSAPSLSSGNDPQVAFITDFAGDYVVSLTLNDGALSSTTTYLLSSAITSPVANAGPDIILPEDRIITVDASDSLVGDPASANYFWSVLGLGSIGAADSAAIDAQTAVQTAITFDTAGSGTISSPAEALGIYDLIVFENSNSRSQSRGRTFIGGNLNGQSSDYGNNLGGNVNGDPILTVGGNINGQPKNINNGGSVRVGGRANARLNLNGGGSLINDPDVSITSVRNQMEAFSSFLTALPDTGSINLPGNQPASVTLNAVPDANGVAIFSIVNGNKLFNNNKMQSIDINLNGAEVVVVNVGGKNVKLNKANFVGNANSEDVRSKVLWNFHEAVNIKTTRHLSGSMLAPNAQLQNRSPIYGAAVVRNINHRAAIGAPGFVAVDAFSDIPDPIDVAVVQVQLTDANGTDVDTVLATNGNIAPIATITAKVTLVDIGSGITLQANGSTDANADLLSSRWALLSRPEGSETELVIGVGGQTASIIPDARGAYVAQLIVSDGSLESKPATLIVFGNNQLPQITSTPATEGVVGAEYVYQAEATDADGDTLRWELVSAPQGATIDAVTGLVSFTPVNPGQQEIEIAVTDGFGGRDTQNYTIEVQDPRNLFPPTIQAPDVITVRPGELVQFAVTANDPEGEVLLFTSATLPESSVLDGATGSFNFVPDESNIGTTVLTFTVTDGVLSASATTTLIVEPHPETDPTLLSGQVLDLQDFNNGVITPVAGATLTLQSQVITTAADGTFNFADLSGFGLTSLLVNGATATPASNGSNYAQLNTSLRIYDNAPNVQEKPILLARVAGSNPELITVNDTLPPNLRACQIQLATSADGSSLSLADLGLQSVDQLAIGTRALVWAKNATSTEYTIVDSATIAADGITLDGLTQAVPSGTNLTVTPLNLTGQESDLQPKDSYVLSILGEGNLQTGFTIPSYSSLSSNRAPSFIYNSSTANPRPVITADITIPADTALTGNLEAELFINGQRVPGITTTNLTQAQTGIQASNTEVPQQGEESVASISVTFDGSAYQTGVYDYTLYVFAGHDCAAAAAEVAGNVFINNRTNSPYGQGWKPTEIQTLIQQPDGSVIIEEPNGRLSLYDIDGIPDSEIAEPYTEGFDEGLGDWEINSDGQSLTFDPDAGNPGGALVGVDRAVGGIWFYVAPQIIVEELRGYFDGRISYEIRQTRSNRQFESLDIIIFGEDENGDELVVTFDFPNNPLITFTPFTTLLDGGDGWSTAESFVGDGGFIRYRPNGVPTREQFEQVLSTANNLWIRGEYRVGADTAILDNIQLIGRDLVGQSLAFNTPDGNFDSLTQNTDGTYSRRYTDGTEVVFNSLGLQSSITDRNGNVTAYEYDAEGRIISITDPVGLVTTYSYNSNGQLDTIVDPDNRLSTFAYDVNGTLLQANYPDNTNTQMSYDENGNLLSETDQRGETTSYNYDPNGKLTSTILPDGGTVQLDIARSLGLSEFGVDLSGPDANAANFVDPDDRITRLEDARGNAAVKRVNEWGAVVETFDPIGRTTLFDRDENNLVTRIDAPSSSTPDGRLFTELAYDENGNTTLKREAVGTPNQREMIYEYEPVFSKVTRMVDHEGFEWTYEYDDKGNVIRANNPDGTFMLYTYNAQGQKITGTDERGNVTTYTYDAIGRMDGMTDERGIINRYVLDGAGNPATVIEAFQTADEQRINKTFDDFNRILTSENGENEIMSYGYDNFGNQTTTVDATGVEADKVYDNKSRVASVVDPASGTTSIDYDLTDNITQVVESDGTTSTMVYDEVNRISETTDGINVTRRYVYDLRDNIIAVTDGRGNTTTFAYDELDRLIARTNQVGNTWSFEYDRRDLRTATIKPDGTRIEFTYDNRSRLTSYGAVGDATSIRSFTYDEEDNLLSATAAVGTDQEIAHSFTYDERDQLSQAALAAGPLGGAFSYDYEYDALQRRSTMRDSAGGVTRYTYDSANRLVSIEVPSGRIVDITYDDASRRSNVAMPNGLNARATFQTPASNGNTTGLLASIEHGLNNAGATGSALNQLLGTFSYDYNQKANITAITESGSVARQRNYTLDPIERLTNVADGSGTSLENYTLDEEGNRITSHLASFHVTNPANRVTEDEAFQFEYDVNGNLVRKTTKATGETWVYEYSVYDELIRASRQSGLDAATAQESIAYVFDAMGRRHFREIRDVSGATTSSTIWHYDALNISHQVDVDEVGNSENRRYSYSDTIDDVIALTLSNADGTPRQDSFYYHVDHQGSVRALTDENGQIINQYSYSAYGIEETVVEAVPQQFRFTGREYELETGLYYYRARHYDPISGRFNQEDPLHFEARNANRSTFVDEKFPEDKIDQRFFIGFASELNVYRYVTNNPHNYVDPTGMLGGSYQGFALRAAIIYPVAKKALGRALKRIGERTKYEVYRNSDKITDGITCGQAFSKGYDFNPLTDTQKKASLQYGCYLAGSITGGIARFFGG